MIGDEIDPFTSDPEDPLSPEDQAILSGIYSDLPAFDYHHSTQQHFEPSQYVQRTSNDAYMMNVPMDLQTPRGAPSTHFHSPMLQQTSMYEYPPPHRQSSSQPLQLSNLPPCYSPSSLEESEDATVKKGVLLNVPVKTLSEEEKKLRRRAQVAKSARKHRNRQKEELTQLRAQVQQLQEQMMKMRESSNHDDETDAITTHRKRKMMEDRQPTIHLRLATPDKNLETMKHWYYHLSIDPFDRSNMLKRIATTRAQYVSQYLENNFKELTANTKPFFDIKLFSDGPDLEIKVTRALRIPGFTHLEVSNAAWNSVYNFNLQIPSEYRIHFSCEVC